MIQIDRKIMNLRSHKECKLACSYKSNPHQDDEFENVSIQPVVYMGFKNVKSSYKGLHHH